MLLAAAAVPSECPPIPVPFEPRLEMFEQLLARSSDMAASGIAGATAIVGMGGSGKSTIAAALLRVLAHSADYDRTCWVSVGQTPDLSYLLSLLHKQLVQAPTVELETHDVAQLSARVAQAASERLVFVVVRADRTLALTS